jgi:hypothetical protein
MHHRILYGLTYLAATLSLAHHPPRAAHRPACYRRRRPAMTAATSGSAATEVEAASIVLGIAPLASGHPGSACESGCNWWWLVS